MNDEATTLKQKQTAALETMRRNIDAAIALEKANLTMLKSQGDNAGNVLQNNLRASEAERNNDTATVIGATIGFAVVLIGTMCLLRHLNK